MRGKREKESEGMKREKQKGRGGGKGEKREEEGGGGEQGRSRKKEGGERGNGGREEIGRGITAKGLHFPQSSRVVRYLTWGEHPRKHKGESLRVKRTGLKEKEREGGKIEKGRKWEERGGGEKRKKKRGERRVVAGRRGTNVKKKGL